MGIFSGVLLASDFDGTISGRNGVTEKAKEALRSFVAQGGCFTVSTGRSLQGFHAYDPTFINAPVLLANGGMIYDFAANRVVLCEGIGPEGNDAFRAVAQMFPEVSIEMYATGKTFCIHPQDKAHRHFTAQGIDYTVVTDPSEAKGPFAKVMLGGTEEEIARVQKLLAADFPQVGFVPTDGGYLEVLRPGVQKGSTLKKLAAYLGIDMSRVYAAGDGYNDVDMLKIAAGAFVPADGDSYALACATHLIPSATEGGISEAVAILEEIYG